MSCPDSGSGLASQDKCFVHKLVNFNFLLHFKIFPGQVSRRRWHAIASVYHMRVPKKTEVFQIRWFLCCPLSYFNKILRGGFLYHSRVGPRACALPSGRCNLILRFVDLCVTPEVRLNPGDPPQAALSPALQRFWTILRLPPSPIRGGSADYFPSVNFLTLASCACDRRGC